MSGSRSESEAQGADGTPPEAVAGGSQWHPLTTAAIIGGAVAATAGAYLGTRALARRNAGKDGKPVNSVLATAITACSLAPKKEEKQPSAAEIVIDRRSQG
jgi:hypothetical protein